MRRHVEEPKLTGASSSITNSAALHGGHRAAGDTTHGTANSGRFKCMNEGGGPRLPHFTRLGMRAAGRRTFTFVGLKCT